MTDDDDDFADVTPVKSGEEPARGGDGVKAAKKEPRRKQPPRTPPDGPSGPSTPKKTGNSGLPDDFPVQPLGQVGGKYYFLTARGELTEMSAKDLSSRAHLVGLVSGASDALGWLARIGPPKNARDSIFNVIAVADKLMAACSALPLFDAAVSVRHYGTWRGPSAAPVVHTGEQVLCRHADDRVGKMIGRALYPAVPSRAAPGENPAAQSDLEWVCARLGRFWNWQNETDAAVLIGFIGQAALGQYPQWRSHMWIKGKLGCGKSTLLRIVSALLGGMSSGVRKGGTAAAVRQTTNRMAITRIFDEAESDGSGQMEAIVALFRLMSDADGAQVERGTSDHAGIRFGLYGAGLMASIIPGIMTPADRSRFVILNLGPQTGDNSPEDTALLLDELERDAAALGPAIWRRMVDLAEHRWDSAFRIYSSLVQGLGATSRTGDTIGAILAGWDLMLYDSPLADPVRGALDAERISAAKAIAQPLIDAAVEAEEEGEGDRCLNALFAFLIPKDHGGHISTAELLERCVGDPGPPDATDRALLGRIGLRVMPGDAGTRALFVANGQNSLLDRALAGTRWRAGGHRAALDTLDGVAASPKPQRVAGRMRRGLIVPARYLPGYAGSNGG